MKLNPDCIRDILLTVEEHSDFSHATEFVIGGDFPYLSKYSLEEIAYHINQCEKANLIHDVHFYDGGKSIDISDLTPQGHEFISNIRSDTIWNKTKSIASDVGSYSLDTLTKISIGVLTALIKSRI